MRKLAGFGTFLIVVMFGLAIWLSWGSNLDDRSPEGETADGSHSYSDVRILDHWGTFAGRLSIRNHTDLDTYVLVRVNIFDGDQNVAQMMGTVSLKPESESSVDVTGADTYGPYTEARVHLLAMPQ